MAMLAWVLLHVKYLIDRSFESKIKELNMAMLARVLLHIKHLILNR